MANRRTELTTTLNRFYEQPIARVSLELFITILVVMFFAVFAIRPTLITMSDLIKEIDDKKALDTALEQKVAALSTAQGEYLGLQDRLTILDQAIPSDPQILTALSVIERAASDRKIAITNVSIPELPTNLFTGATTPPVEPVPADGTAPAETPAPDAATNPSGALEKKNLVIKVTIAGDYLTIQQYIKDLQNSRRLVVVDSIEYAVTEEDAAKSLRASLTLNMPYFGN